MPIAHLGRVEDGTAHLDFEPEGQKRHESLSLAVGTFEADGTRISLVDTPGYPDFFADIIKGFAAADGAIFVVDASDNRPTSGAAVAIKRETNTAACFFINKSERENGDPTAALDAPLGDLRRQDRAAPLAWAAESFEGYVDLVHRKAWTLGWHDRGRGPDPGRPGGRGGPPPGPSCSKRPPRRTTTC